MSRAITNKKGLIDIDGKQYPFTITRFSRGRNHGCAHFYIYNNNGQPVAEHSMPDWAHKGSKFYTSGHHYTILGDMR